VVAQHPCDASAPPLAPSRDLYCLELAAPPGISGASGVVELGWTPGPFTIPVNSDGRLRYAPTTILAGLPAPRTLGSYTTYVAWLATPVLHPVVKLGPVANGRTALPAIDLDKFLILITAEASSDVAEPTGRLVLRGASPSTRLQPPDLLQFTVGATRDAAAEHVHHADTVAGILRWTTVPMPPNISMLPAEMALRPDVRPYLPAPSAHARPPAARPHELVTLASGDTLRLTAGLVRRAFKGRTLTMYGFNGQYPGPLLRVPQGAEVVVDFSNALDQPTTVHWHGVRLDNHFDGVPELTQAAVSPGGRFLYRLRFPDAGIYWYHPHVREDTQQDLGLYGNILVRSPRADYFSAAHREEALMLDDLLLGDDGLVPFGREATTHALMGRFGNVFLVNGEPGYELAVRRGEVVRFLFTNVSNTRTFNLSFPGARMKVVGSDLGNYEREEWIESVVLAPAERYIVHVRFEVPGSVALVNRVQALDHLYGRFFYETDTLGIVRVSAAAAASDLTTSFATLRADRGASDEINRYRSYADRRVDHALILTLETRDLPFVTRQLMMLDSAYFAPVEWSGTMPHMNWASTGGQVRWVMRDPATGKENMDVDWSFRRGDVVKLRLANERRSFHAMQHPIHIHGQRFLVLAVNGVPNENLVWKDTVLVPAGSTVDVLLELSNPGRWMLHCHIAEHLSAEMMMAFTVN
jgi:FtsP/CotA-like multicopper oxidase with cupredoxin domain